jgi:hypothetical protein
MMTWPSTLMARRAIVVIATDCISQSLAARRMTMRLL